MTEVEVLKSTWIEKGATLSDKSARKEFGLTQEEIIEGIRGGKLHYQENNVYGNPFLRLIRSEVEAFVDEKHGSNYLNMKKIKKELAQTRKKRLRGHRNGKNFHCNCVECKNPLTGIDVEEYSICALQNINSVKNLSQEELDEEHELPCGCESVQPQKSQQYHLIYSVNSRYLFMRIRSMLYINHWR